MYALCDPKVYKTAIISPVAEVINVLYQNTTAFKSLFSLSNHRPINVIHLQKPESVTGKYLPAFQFVENITPNGVFPAFERAYNHNITTSNFDLDCNLFLRSITDIVVIEMNTDDYKIPVLYCKDGDIIPGQYKQIQMLTKKIIAELEKRGEVINNFSVSRVFPHYDDDYQILNNIMTSPAYNWNDITFDLTSEEQ